MIRDYSRPSGFARWGWIGFAWNVAMVALNLALIAFADASAWSWFAVAVCAAAAYACWWMWRDGVKSDAAHRARMAAFDARWLP